MVKVWRRTTSEVKEIQRHYAFLYIEGHVCGLWIMIENKQIRFQVLPYHVQNSDHE